jgi:hypothetical protein
LILMADKQVRPSEGQHKRGWVTTQNRIEAAARWTAFAIFM